MKFFRTLIGFIVTLFFPLATMGKDNQISISYSNTAGNTDTQTLSIGYNLERNWDSLRFYSDGSYLYKEDSGRETANKLTINNRGEADITGRILFFVKNFIKRDKFSGYNLRFGLGPGIGYQLIKKDNENLKLFLGTDFTYNDYTEGGTENYASGDVSLEYNRQLLENLLFTQKISYLVSFKNSDDYFIHSETNFEVPITEKMALGISYKVDYHNLLPEDAEYHTDRVFSTSLIYRF